MGNDNDEIMNLSEHLIEMEIRMQKQAREKKKVVKSGFHNPDAESKNSPTEQG